MHEAGIGFKLASWREARPDGTAEEPGGKSAEEEADRDKVVERRNASKQQVKEHESRVKGVIRALFVDNTATTSLY